MVLQRAKAARSASLRSLAGSSARYFGQVRSGPSADTKSMVCAVARPAGNRQDKTIDRSSFMAAAMLSDSAQALFFGGLQHAHARLVAFVHDAVQLGAFRRAQQVGQGF